MIRARRNWKSWEEELVEHAAGKSLGLAQTRL
jgi:hypothetical protein